MSSKKTEYNEWSLLLIFILAALFLGLFLAIFYHILRHIRQKLEARRRYLQEQRKTQSKLDKQVAKKNFIDQIEEIKDRRTRGKLGLEIKRKAGFSSDINDFQPNFSSLMKNHVSAKRVVLKSSNTQLECQEFQRIFHRELFDTKDTVTGAKATSVESSSQTSLPSAAFHLVGVQQ